MVLDTEAARLLVFQAGHLKNKGVRNTRETSLAKLYASEAALRCGNKAIQVFGGYGYMKDYPIERYFRDAQVINVMCSYPADEKELIAKETIG